VLTHLHGGADARRHVRLAAPLNTATAASAPFNTPAAPFDATAAAARGEAFALGRRGASGAPRPVMGREVSSPTLPAAFTIGVLLVESDSGRQASAAARLAGMAAFGACLGSSLSACM